MEPLEQQLTQLIADHKDFVGKIGEEMKSFGKVRPETEAQFTEIRAKMDTFHTRLDALDLDRQERPGGGLQQVKSLGQLVTEHKEVLEAKEKGWGRKGASIQIDGSAFPGGTPLSRIANLYQKATITNTGLGSGTSGIAMPMSIGDQPLLLAQQELRIRDVINVQPFTQGNTYMWVRQSTRTNAASPQTEAAAKAESTYAWDTQSGVIRTIAHWTNVSRQALDDISWLRSEIDNELMYGLLLKEEAEILAGSGTGEHLNGIITQATAYASGTYNVSGDTKLDKLRHGKLQARLAGLATFAPDAFVLNPRDMHDIELLKSEEGGANKGLYIVGDPTRGTQVKFVWGLPVVESDSITYGTFLTGAFRTAATLLDRMKANVDISYENNDNFTKNLATVLAEERVGLAVKRPTAFITGSL